MKSYLEASGVPTVSIGAAQVPRLVMGIHPYDGCSYQDAERDADNLRRFGTVGQVVDVLRVAVEEFGVTTAQVDHMIPHLDRLHLQAVWETERRTDTQIGLLPYILIPVTLDGEIVSRRCGGPSRDRECGHATGWREMSWAWRARLTQGSATISPSGPL